MKTRTAALLAAIAVALAACSSSDDGSTPSPEPASTADQQAAEPVAPVQPDTSADEPLPEEVAAMLEGYDVPAEDGVRAAIVALDEVDQQRPLSVQASVRTDDVVFSDGEQEITVPIPGDLVYVSVGPYVDQTHPCHFHALGGCQGEMVGEEVDVQIVDHMGEVLVDETVTTRANGFVGYWLPKDAHGTVTITQGELTGVAAFETGDIAGLEAVLAADVVAYSDGGGKARAARYPIVGADAASRFFAALRRRFSVAEVRRVEINGAPGALLRFGRQLQVLSVAVAGGRIREIDSVMNPDKLRYIQRQLAAD